MPTAGRHNSAHVLDVHEQFYLIDCGEGTQMQLRRYGISPLKLHSIFITHLHGDHVFGLPGLISSMNAMRRRTPLYIYGVHPLDELLAHHRRYFDPVTEFDIVYREVDARRNERVFENKVMEVFTVPLRHRVPTTGYLFREKRPGLNVRKEMIGPYGLTLKEIVGLKRGEDLVREDGTTVPNAELTYTPYEPRSYAHLSDTLYSPKAAELVKGVDLLYHEATYLDADRKTARQNGHSTALQAAKAAVLADAGQLLLGHFSARYKDENLFLEEARQIFPNTLLAREGETVEIPVRRRRK